MRGGGSGGGGKLVETCSSGFNERLAGVERRIESK